MDHLLFSTLILSGREGRNGKMFSRIRKLRCVAVYPVQLGSVAEP